MTLTQSTRLTNEDASTAFLLAEHERLVQLFLDTRESAERRVTLYLTLVTGILTALVALTQFAGLETTLETALAAAVGLAALGAITFQRLLERSMQGTEYLRALNRIHHYFVERDPALEPYLFWPPYDNLPRYDRHGVGGVETREVVAFLNSGFSGFAVGLGLYFAFGVSIALLILPAALVGALAFGLHIVYERRKFALEERAKAINIRFPVPPQIILDDEAKEGE
ncbi:MAG TPA: hypothetical protein VIX58_08380 [Anaerolineae bacterium]